MIRGGDPKAHKLMEAFHRFRRLEIHKHSLRGYKASEIRMLFFILRGSREDDRGVTISALSGMLEVTSPTVTPLIRSLENHGLVVRYNDQEDRRVVRVKLSEKGEEVTRKAMESFSRKLMGLYDFLGEDRSNQLLELLDLVYEYLEKQQKED